jgi:hypothetical protein
VTFDVAHFNEFTQVLRINTKERGVVFLGDSFMGTQKRWLKEVTIGMEMGVREFVTLKCRQIGISTISLAMDLYWIFGHECQGSIVVHEESARDQFRAILDMYYEGLPGVWKQPVVQHNRNQLLLGNGSLLQYKVAGLKETSSKSLGRSSALSFGHMTEVAYWGDPQQISSLKSSMAEENPNRFFNWETTANGFNHFNDMWDESHGSVSIRPIFVTWWSNEFYRAKRGSAKFKQYWGERGRATDQEKDWIKQVKLDYDHDIDEEQLAWYRWNRAEKVTDEMDLYAEFPTVPEDAFVATGSKFFTGKSLSAAYRKVLAEPKPKFLRFKFGEEFVNTEIEECNDRVAHLKVWEEPVKGAYYSIGADPAYGSSQDSDRYVVQVNRCWANRVEQVAEFCVVEMSSYTFAWVIVYLCGCYSPAVYNIEINGPGGSIIAEIDNLRRLAGRGRVPGEAKTMMDVVRNMQEFLYVRDDSLMQRPHGKHTLTTDRIKDAYMSMYRDNFERGILVPHSRFLLDEMKTVVRDGTWVGAEGGGKDDRVIANALSVLAWNAQLRQRLISQNIVWLSPEQQELVKVYPPSVLGRNLQSYLQSFGYMKKQEGEQRVKAYNVGTRK